MKVKIEQKRDECIGCGACVALAGKFFEMADDGKAKIKGAKEREVTTDEFEDLKNAAESCPVNIITIKKA